MDTKNTKKEHKECFKGGKAGSGTGLVASGVSVGLLTANAGSESGTSAPACLKDSSSLYCKLFLFLSNLKMIILIIVIMCAVLAFLYYAYKYFVGSKSTPKSKR